MSSGVQRVGPVGDGGMGEERRPWVTNRRGFYGPSPEGEATSGSQVDAPTTDTRSRMTPERDPLRLLYLEDAAKILGVDTAFLEELLEAGEVGAVKRGREWRVPDRALELWVENIAQGAPPRPTDVTPRRGRPPKHRLLG